MSVMLSAARSLRAPLMSLRGGALVSARAHSHSHGHGDCNHSHTHMSVTSRMVKSVRFNQPGGRDQLSMVEAPLGEPGEGQVRVRIAACGVCYRDVLDRKGAFPFIKHNVVPGHEFAGIVEKVGRRVSTFREGDRVANLHWSPCGVCECCLEGRPTHCLRRRETFVGLTVDGGYAQYATVAQGGLVHVPQGFSAAEAATVNCTFGTIWHGAVTRGRLQPGERVLVTGATGGVGTAAVQLAKSLGCHVVAVTSNPAKADFLTRLGADDVIINTDAAPFFRDKRIGAGVHVAIEAVGAPTFGQSLRSLRPAGRLVLLGNVTVGTAETPIGLQILNGLEVIGSDSCSAGELARCFEFMRRTGIRPVIDREMRLEEYGEAQRMLEDKEVTGRIVLRVNDEW